MIKRSLAIFAVCIFAASAAAAQSIHTPAKNSAERAAILNGLRLPVEKDLKQKIVFVTDIFNVQGSWAYVSGTPQTPDGGRPDYRNTRYADAVNSGAFDNNIFALLKRTSGKWKVVTYAIGCTDVCYLDWWSRFKAPKAIFPHTE